MAVLSSHVPTHHTSKTQTRVSTLNHANQLVQRVSVTSFAPLHLATWLLRAVKGHSRYGTKVRVVSYVMSTAWPRWRHCAREVDHVNHRRE